MLASFHAEAGPPANGGWCAVTQPQGWGTAQPRLLAEGDIQRIVAYVWLWMMHNGYGLPGGIAPAPWAMPVFLQMKATLENGLRPLIGVKTCADLPANLEDVPTVKQATPPTDAGGVLNAIIDFAQLGDVLVRVGVLVAILALGLVAIRRVIG